MAEALVGPGEGVDRVTFANSRGRFECWNSRIYIWSSTFRRGQKTTVSLEEMMFENQVRAVGVMPLESLVFGPNGSNEPRRRSKNMLQIE